MSDLRTKLTSALEPTEQALRVVDLLERHHERWWDGAEVEEKIFAALSPYAHRWADDAYVRGNGKAGADRIGRARARDLELSPPRDARDRERRAVPYDLALEILALIGADAEEALDLAGDKGRKGIGKERDRIHFRFEAAEAIKGVLEKVDDAVAVLDPVEDDLSVAQIQKRRTQEAEKYDLALEICARLEAEAKRTGDPDLASDVLELVGDGAKSAAKERTRVLAQLDAAATVKRILDQAERKYGRQAWDEDDPITEILALAQGGK